MTEYSAANGQGPGYRGEVPPPYGNPATDPAPSPIVQPAPQMQYAPAPAPMPMVVNNVVAPPVMMAPPKSTGVAFVLTFFFGPFGLFYSSVTGGLIMTLLGIPFSILTFGVGYFFVWVGSIIWGCVAADSHNKKMLMGVPVMAPTMSYMAPQPVMNQPMPVAPPQQPPPTSTYALAVPSVGTASATCPACAAPLQDGTQFCTTCGARRDQVPEPVVVDAAPAGGATYVVRRCPQGHIVDDGNAFCPRCGGAAS